MAGFTDKLKTVKTFASAKKDYLKGKKDEIYNSGKLEKACLVIYQGDGKNRSVATKVNVQFNPSEYSISRGNRLSERDALGVDPSPEDMQVTGGRASTLSLTLYFDSYTELNAGLGITEYALTNVKDLLSKKKADKLPSADMNEESRPNPEYRVNYLCDMFVGLVKSTHEEHAPPTIGFIWGKSLHFVGTAASTTVQYTVFDRDGTPLRAKVSLEIRGEDLAFTRKAKEYPNESPDRTKQRTLYYGEQLWMMAQSEYGDPTQWKTIAQSNGILNPRTMHSVVQLKVPSIR